MDETSKRLNAVQAMAIMPLSFTLLLVIGMVSVIGFVEGGGSPGLIEAIFAVGVVANLFYYIQTDKLVISIQVLIGLLAAFFVATLYTGSASRIGVHWMMLFPVVATLLLGRKIAGALSGVLIFGSVPALVMTNAWDTTYSSATLASILMGIGLLMPLLGYYDKFMDQPAAEKDIEQKTERGNAANIKVEIAQRENAEAQMSRALQQLEENNEKLERVTAIDEATISSIGEAVLIVDSDGVVVRANPSSGRVLGLNQEDIIGKEITDHLMFALQKDEDALLEREDLVIYQSIAHRSIDAESYKITKPNGKTLYAQMTASPLVVSGEVYGAVVVVRDITEEVGVDRAKTEFVSIASHQLRTPLSTINWYLEMVLAGDFGEVNAEQKEFIEEAYGASKRMGDLINALLNASRLDVGVVAIEPKDNIDTRDIIKGVISDLEAKLAKKKITINQTIAESVQPMRLDERIMEIIFLNLLTNAVKYSPEGSTINLRASTDDEFMTIEVEDHGFGIPASSQDKIFTKMFRAENAIEQEPDGNGLGLYIIKSIVETIGGSIEFVSEEGKGTTFTVKIPKSGMEAREGAKQLSLDPNLN